MEPIDYGGVLLRRWWVPVVLGVIWRFWQF